MSTSSDDEDPPPRVWSISDLSNANAKLLLQRASMYSKWKAAVAVAEMKITDRHQKHAMLLNLLTQTVDGLKVNEVSTFMRCDAPNSRDWDAIRYIIKNSVKSGKTVRLN